jgi:hypothetical protein
VLSNFETSSYSSSFSALQTMNCNEMDDNGYTFKYVVPDSAGDFSDYYRANTIPSNLVLDDEFVIRYKLGDYSSSGIRNIVDQLMTE